MTYEADLLIFWLLLSFKIWVLVREDASYVRSMILICDFFILYGPVQPQEEANR